MKLENIFHNNKAFIPYVTAGDPDLGTTEQCVYTLAKAGADAIELGVPFSDSIADGPVIQRAHARALKSGTTLKKIFDLVKKISHNTDVPLLFMLSANSIMQYGTDKFVRAVKECGLNGIIVPDMPFETSTALRGKLDPACPFISFIATTTSDERIRQITRAAHGFIYLISSTGVTGARKALDPRLPSIIKKIKKVKKIPVSVGFGISNATIAKHTAQYADGIIIGAAIVSIIEKEGKNCQNSLYRFACDIKSALAKDK